MVAVFTGSIGPGVLIVRAGEAAVDAGVLEQELLHRDREREGDDREADAAHAQRGERHEDADDHRDRARRRAG